jgi:GTP-binding protein HflX
MAQQQIHDTKNKLEKAVLVGVHAQDDKQFNFESTTPTKTAFSSLFLVS